MPILILMRNFSWFILVVPCDINGSLQPFIITPQRNATWNCWHSEKTWMKHLWLCPVSSQCLPCTYTENELCHQWACRWVVSALDGAMLLELWQQNHKLFCNVYMVVHYFECGLGSRRHHSTWLTRSRKNQDVQRVQRCHLDFSLNEHYLSIHTNVLKRKNNPIPYSHQ